MIRGLKRLWLVLSVAWAIVVGLVSLSMVPIGGGEALPDLARVRAEFVGAVLLQMVLWPAMLYAAGAAMVWVARGFQKRP